MTDTAPTDRDGIDDTTHDVVTDVSDRRTALRRIAIGGGAAAAGMLAFSQNASADSGDPLELGLVSEPGDVAPNNTSDDPTHVTYTGTADDLETGGLSVLGAGAYVPDPDADLSALFPAALGGYGDETVPLGVHGSTTTGDGYGVVAGNFTDTSALDDAADTSPAAMLIASTGTHLRMVPLAVEPGPAPGAHEPGELYFDGETLWFTLAGTNDSVEFVNLTPRVGTRFVPITPARAYDSRQTGYAVRGVIAPLASRVISVANGHNANGTVTDTDVVPTGAVAAQITLTVANPTAENFLAVTPGDATATETSAINFQDGTLQLANSLSIALDADRQIKVFCGDQAGSTEFIVDVTGYYV